METEYQWSVSPEIRVHALPDGTSSQRKAGGSLTQKGVGRWKNINVSLITYVTASTEQMTAAWCSQSDEEVA